MTDWLKDAVFYEIYPQSFYDTNADGTGDFQGIIEKLDYIKELGCNALWLNPCFDSPFKDAGYDVRDYKKVAARYGTNEDLYRLFSEAHKRDMHVFLDLVPGHTSEEHPWFKESARPEKNSYSDRYIWSDEWWCGMAGHAYIAGESERAASYMLNFFKCQPALNYGFHKPQESWQMGIDEPGPSSTREAMVDVMRFWLSHGADGFRVDMADSLVKDDDDKKSATCLSWQRMFAKIRGEFPEAAFVSEWGRPELSVGSAGFDMDFLLDHGGRGYKTLMRDTEGGEDHSYFKKNAGGDIRRFLDDYENCLSAVKGKGYLALISGNHDTPRVCPALSDLEAALAYATLFTLPGIPFLYYGDEIGMRYKDIPTKEGGYGRTGSRTPMQWSESANKGFSATEADRLYLPVDEAGPSVEKQAGDMSSLYERVRAILALRREYGELRADGDFLVLCDKKDAPFVYRRGRLVLAVNPTGGSLAASADTAGGELLYAIGEAELLDETLKLGAQSFAVWKV